MTTPRDHPTATLLNTGQVLVSGGDSAYPGPFVPAYASAELYDPGSGTWSLTDSMANARTRHTATLMNDGRVLVSGGFDPTNNVLASLEIYDPTTQTWSGAGTMTSARVNHTATLLSDGRVLFAGGQDATKRATSTAEVYDPSTGTSAPTGSMQSPRQEHAATLLQDGTVLVVGGLAAEVYDPVAGAWSSTEPMILQRQGPTATLLNDGRVLVAGGDFAINGGTGVTSTAELYDPDLRSWISTTSMNFARDGHRAVPLNDGTVLVVGSAYDGGYVNAEVYDPASATWTLTPNLNIGRPRGHTTTLLGSGQTLVAGGASDATSAELFTNASMVPTASISPARSRSAVTTLGHATAQYDSSEKLLHVRAMSTGGPSTLMAIVTSTGQSLGTLSRTQSGIFEGVFSLPVAPRSIRIRNARGVSVTVRVTRGERTPRHLLG